MSATAAYLSLGKLLYMFLFDNIVLAHTWFCFGTYVYKIIGGTPMGLCHSVALATIYMATLLEAFFVARPMWKSFLPYFGRFIDDIFGFWRGSRASFDTFVDELNIWSRDNGWVIQFEVGVFGDRVPFLDLEVYRNDGGEWHTTLYFKSTDVHAYLSPSSNHPSHIVENIPLGVALRILRACSEWHEFARIRRLFEGVFFPRRGYNWRVVRKGFEIAANKLRADVLVKRPKDKSFEVPFVFPYSRHFEAQPRLNDAGIGFLAARPHHPPPFQTPQRVAYRSAPNIRSKLLRASMLRHKREANRCYRCADASCPLHRFLVEDNSIVSLQTGILHKVRAPINCDTKNAIYVITCFRCGVQGVGECHSLRSRVPTYIDALARDGSTVQDHSCAIIHRHFMDNSHGPHDMTIQFVDALSPCVEG